ncbi:MAG TPA: hypothetical protein VD966_04125 [Pyrinomonadaceae bacterium]|nr:hypothetical protein [Pyrinomonadaceae bacterium]
MNISDYRRDFAAYNSALELAHYQHRAGLDPELRTEPIYDRYGELFTREAIDALQRVLSATPAHLETERAGLRALSGAARVGYLEARAKDLTDERARCESSASLKWDGEHVPAHGVPKMVANEPLAARRRELTARWIDSLSRCDDLRAARLESFHESARALGFDSYRALFTDLTNTDFEQLAGSLDAFLRRTESVYASALAKATARHLPDVAFDDLQYADYFFFQRMSRLDPFFPSNEILTTYRAAMAALGIRVEQQRNIYLDDEPRPLKNPRAACFRINPPDDVRLILAPIGGSYDYTTFFHEAGHAQHFGWSSRDLIKRHPEFAYSPDSATTEGYAFLLNHLFHDPEWLSEYRGGIGPSRARGIVRDLALLTLHNIRRRCASVKYEIALHDGSRVRSEQLAATYATLQEQATLFRRSPALYLTDVDDGFYSAIYLRAWAFEAGLREHLRTRHGRRWWATRKAGDELIDLWNTASRYSVEELARLIGFGEISFDLLADNLIAAISEA